MSYFIREMFSRHPQSISEPNKATLTDAISLPQLSSSLYSMFGCLFGGKGGGTFRNYPLLMIAAIVYCKHIAVSIIRLQRTQSLITACIEQVQYTSIQCNEHAHRHEHCRVCADTCRACENTLSEYLKFLG